MENNMELYEKFRKPPKEALRTIKGGRLNGMTDINPMWRIKALTERFGPCGLGWKYVITDKRLEPGTGGQISAFVDVDLFVKYQGDVWSEAIPGTGGASFIAQERSGLYQSDECFKMALTDAISIACKALGMGADVYYRNDCTKYSDIENVRNAQTAPSQPRQAPVRQNTVNNTRNIDNRQNAPVDSGRRGNMQSIGETLKPVTKAKDWNEIAKEPQWQNAKCIVCGNPVDRVIAAKSFNAYGNVFCSKACKDEFERRKATH